MPLIPEYLSKNNATNSHITVIGGANRDIMGKATESLVEQSSTPGKVSSSTGGVGKNIAHNMGLLGVTTKFISAVGDDSGGKKIINELYQNQVDTNNFIVSNNTPTGTYLSILDENNDLYTAIADMEILKNLSPWYMVEIKETITTSKFIIADTNLHTDTLAEICKICAEQQIKLLIDPVSAAKASKLNGLLPAIDIITPNITELEIITDRSIQTEDDLITAATELNYAGTELVITTMGDQGIYVSHPEISDFFSPKLAEIVNTTGAGDAFNAGLIFGLLNQQSLANSINTALEASKYTIANPNSVNPDLPALLRRKIK